MLLNVGSGGSAAAAPTGGATGGAAAEAPAAAAEEEKKEEGKLGQAPSLRDRPFGLLTNSCQQRRKNRTRTWVSVSSTRLRPSTAPLLSSCPHCAWLRASWCEGCYWSKVQHQAL